MAVNGAINQIDHEAAPALNLIVIFPTVASGMAAIGLQGLSHVPRSGDADEPAIFTLSCPNQLGIVAAVAIAIFEQETRSDLVVRTRYLPMLSDDLVAKLAGRCINIHHFFLPGFKSAKPYHQAHACSTACAP